MLQVDNSAEIRPAKGDGLEVTNPRGYLSTYEENAIVEFSFDKPAHGSVDSRMPRDGTHVTKSFHVSDPEHGPCRAISSISWIF